MGVLDIRLFAMRSRLRVLVRPTLPAQGLAVSCAGNRLPVILRSLTKRSAVDTFHSVGRYALPVLRKCEYLFCVYIIKFSA